MVFSQKMKVELAITGVNLGIFTNQVTIHRQFSVRFQLGELARNELETD